MGWFLQIKNTLIQNNNKKMKTIKIKIMQLLLSSIKIWKKHMIVKIKTQISTNA